MEKNIIITLSIVVGALMIILGVVAVKFGAQGATFAMFNMMDGESNDVLRVVTPGPELVPATPYITPTVTPTAVAKNKHVQETCIKVTQDLYDPSLGIADFNNIPNKTYSHSGSYRGDMSTSNPAAMVEVSVWAKDPTVNLRDWYYYERFEGKAGTVTDAVYEHEVGPGRHIATPYNNDSVTYSMWDKCDNNDLPRLSTDCNNISGTLTRSARALLDKQYIGEEVCVKAEYK